MNGPKILFQHLISPDGKAIATAKSVAIASGDTAETVIQSVKVNISSENGCSSSSASSSNSASSQSSAN